MQFYRDQISNNGAMRGEELTCREDRDHSKLHSVSAIQVKGGPGMNQPPSLKPVLVLLIPGPSKFRPERKASSGERHDDDGIL